MFQPTLLQRGLWLEYATLGWNLIGTAVAFVAAVRSGSVALLGFGLDSLIEIFASVVVIWQLKGIEQNREMHALRLIGAAFILLAVYIFIQSTVSLWRGTRPDPSSLGLILLAATFVAMLFLACGKGITGRQLGNLVLMAEARVTMIDGVLAGAVLVGVGLNDLCALWWADSLAGFVIVFY